MYNYNTQGNVMTLVHPLCVHTILGGENREERKEEGREEGKRTIRLLQVKGY